MSDPLQVQVRILVLPDTHLGIDLPARLAATGHAEVEADVRLLLLHQAVEGATVGPQSFVFRDAAEVVRCSDLRTHAAALAAVLCGHVHRAQVLGCDLAGRRLPMPVLYSASTERASSAERDEAKSTLWLAIDRGAGGAPRRCRCYAWRRYGSWRPRASTFQSRGGLGSAPADPPANKQLAPFQYRVTGDLDQRSGTFPARTAGPRSGPIRVADPGPHIGT